MQSFWKLYVNRPVTFCHHLVQVQTNSMWDVLNWDAHGICMHVVGTWKSEFMSTTQPSSSVASYQKVTYVALWTGVWSPGFKDLVLSISNSRRSFPLINPKSRHDMHCPIVIYVDKSRCIRVGRKLPSPSPTEIDPSVSIYFLNPAMSLCDKGRLLKKFWIPTLPGWIQDTEMRNSSLLVHIEHYHDPGTLP